VPNVVPNPTYRYRSPNDLMGGQKPHLMTLVTNNMGAETQLGYAPSIVSAPRIPTTSIAVSTGQSDAGLFEVNFRDDRYMPFEGAGAISRWRIELPAKIREFDYSSITDVLTQLRYTARDGGDKIVTAAEGAVEAYLKTVEGLSQDQGLFAFFDILHDFPNAWYKANQLAPGATERLTVRFTPTASSSDPSRR